MNIILFGEMGAGKSTVADYLAAKFGFNIRSLGDKIHSETRLHGKETRSEMQKYGQMMRKIFGENVWCDYLYSQNKDAKSIVIDDARQLNEFDYFTTRDFIPIAVISDDHIRLDRLQKRVNYVVDPNTFLHETEVQARECVNKCNIKLTNNSTDKDLFKQINNVLNDLLFKEMDDLK